MLIDELIVSLNLDAKKFTQGQRDAISGLKKLEDQAAKSNKTVSTGADQINEGFKAATKSALGFAAVLVGGRSFTQLFADAVQSSAAVGRLAGNLNMATTALSGWQNAAQGNGGTSAGISAALTTASQGVVNVEHGVASPFITGMQRLGLGVVGKDGQPLGADQMLLELADKLHSMSRPQGMWVASQMGLDQGTYNFLSQGSAAVSAEVGANSNTNQKEAAAAQALIASFTHLSKQVDGLANIIMAISAPFLTKDMGFLSDMIGEYTDLLSGKISPAQFMKDFQTGYGVLKTVALADVGDQSGAVATARATLAQRNNNPGNLRYVGQAGAQMGADGFAAFATPQAGMAALQNQIGLYGSRGLDTISSIITKYEGGTNPNDTGAGNADHNNIRAYIASVSKAMGISANAQLDLSDPNVVQALANAIAVHEGYYSPSSIGTRLPGSVQSAVFALKQARLRAHPRGGATTVSIHTINVSAPHADAKQVVNHIGKNLAATIVQNAANRGLQ